MIPQDTIMSILDSVRIEEVVGDFVSLKKRGANLIGVCPFHKEKTPSFIVSPAKGIFKCFGCGKAGDSVRFIMEHEHYSYPEALRFLAQKYGIIIEEKERTPEELMAQNEMSGLMFKMENDPRITKIGGFMRKTSIDELPQIINILKGDMSIIGPRPALWNQDDLIEERDKYGANNVRPGLTGLAQISGRDDIDDYKKVEYDLKYLINRSLMLDIKIMINTFLKLCVIIV